MIRSIIYALPTLILAGSALAQTATVPAIPGAAPSVNSGEDDGQLVDCGYTPAYARPTFRDWQ